MIEGEYKKILFDIFDVMRFSDSEKEKAVDIFKRKLAVALWDLLVPELKSEDPVLVPDDLKPHDPRVLKIKKELERRYSKKELYKKSRPLFKKLLEDYIEFMSRALDSETNRRLRAVVDNFKA